MCHLYVCSRHLANQNSSNILTVSHVIHLSCIRHIYFDLNGPLSIQLPSINYNIYNLGKNMYMF